MLRSERIENIAADCIHFQKDGPCQPHCRGGHTCRCAMYRPFSSRVLFVQLSSPAEVIASSAIIFHLKEKDPNIRITYLTRWPELLPISVDEPMALNAASLKVAELSSYDKAYNLDISTEACAIFNGISASEKHGFFFKNNRPGPLDKATEQIYLEKIFPRKVLNKDFWSTRSLFNICGFEYDMQKPFLQKSEASPPRKLAVCTVTDPENKKKIWPAAMFSRLTNILADTFDINLIGNDDSFLKDRFIADNSPVDYAGPLNTAQIIEQFKSVSTIISFARWSSYLGWALGKNIIHIQGQIQAGYIEPTRRLTIITPLIEAGNNNAIETILPETVANVLHKDFVINKNNELAAVR